jgi:hypothetical protein
MRSAVGIRYWQRLLSKITRHSIAVLQILPAIMISQVSFFARYLTLKEPYRGNDIDQEYPIRE